MHPVCHSIQIFRIFCTLQSKFRIFLHARNTKITSTKESFRKHRFLTSLSLILFFSTQQKTESKSCRNCRVQHVRIQQCHKKTPGLKARHALYWNVVWSLTLSIPWFKNGRGIHGSCSIAMRKLHRLLVMEGHFFPGCRLLYWRWSIFHWQAIVHGCCSS